MPRKGLVLSPKTRQTQLQLRADELERRTKKRQIVLAMQNHPRVIGPLHSKLESLEIPNNDYATPDTTTVLSRQAKHNARLAKSGSFSSSGGDAPSSAAAGSSIDPKAFPKQRSLVPLRAKVLADLSLTILRDQILPTLQPTVLSSRNLKASTSNELTSAAGLLRVLEFLTGLVPTQFDLVLSMPTIADVGQHLKQHMQHRMERVLPLSQSLELDWSSMGLLVITEQSSTHVSLLHRYSNERHTITLTAPIGSPATVINNWSEKMVSLQSSGFTQPVGSHFQHLVWGDDGGTPGGNSKKKRRVHDAPTPPKALPSPPVRLALPMPVPSSPPAVAATEVDLTAKSPGSVISDEKGD